jgi:hypothetical protein
MIFAQSNGNHQIATLTHKEVRALLEYALLHSTEAEKTEFREVAGRD